MNWKKETKSLSCELIDSKPRDFNFGEGYCETWDIPLDLTEEERENEDFAPMMNYIYPLGDSFSIPDDFRDKLNNTTIVEIKGEYYLALTGGGMDMTWYIVESFIRLGYYPPIHFCRLPNFAGKNYQTGKTKDIIKICNKALKISCEWALSTIKENKRLYQKD